MRRLAALLAALALVLVACGDDDASSEKTTTTTTSSGEKTTTTTADPDDDESTTTTEAVPKLDAETGALEIYVREILRWPDAEITAASGDEYDITSPTFGTAHAVMAGDDETGWQVDSLYTPMDDATASVKLGYADGNNVTMGYQDSALTPDLTIAYGDSFANLYTQAGQPGERASWPVELDPTLDNGPRRITVLWRDADGAARVATVLPVPAGEFAAD